MDRHWNPYYIHCNLCHTDYTAVLKWDWKLRWRKKLNLWWPGWSPWRRRSHSSWLLATCLTCWPPAGWIGAWHPPGHLTVVLAILLAVLVNSPNNYCPGTMALAQHSYSGSTTHSSPSQWVNTDSGEWCNWWVSSWSRQQYMWVKPSDRRKCTWFWGKLYFFFGITKANWKMFLIYWDWVRHWLLKHWITHSLIDLRLDTFYLNDMHVSSESVKPKVFWNLSGK